MLPGHFLDFNSLILLCVQIFLIGLCGLVSSQNNIIFMIISIEMMLLASGLLFIFTSTQFNYIEGQIFALFILTIAAAESAIGLAIVVAFYRLRFSTNLESINLLKG